MNFSAIKRVRLVPCNTHKRNKLYVEGNGLFLLMQEKEQAGLTEGEIKVIGENIIRKTTDLYRPAV